MLYLTRKVTFCASHRYHREAWNEETNRRVFGKCVRSHGHNYVCEVTVRGDVDPTTGMVLNLTELDRILKEQVVEPYDHRFINEDVPGFDRLVPTTENLAIDIWGRVARKLEGCALHRVRLYEDPDLFVDYLAKIDLTRVYRFCAGHRLFNPTRDDAWNRAVFGKCSLPDGHGHNFRLEVTVTGRPDPLTGFSVPLDALDSAVKSSVLDPLDHHSLNVELDGRGFPIPTTEAVAQFAWRSIAPTLPAGVTLKAVRVTETDNNVFEYFGD